VEESTGLGVDEGKKSLVRMGASGVGVSSSKSDVGGGVEDSTGLGVD